MGIEADISDIERRLREARIPLGHLLREAQIDRSTWGRWRSGSTSPRLTNWRSIETAVQRLFANSTEVLP